AEKWDNMGSYADSRAYGATVVCAVESRRRGAAGVVSSRAGVEPVSGRQPVRPHLVEDPRRLLSEFDSRHCTDTRRLSMAGYGIRPAALRRCSASPLAAPAGSASPGHFYLEPARGARRHAL